jgi:predicted secreted protein
MPTQSLEPPSELLLRPGEDARFRIGGAGSVGYAWTWTIDGDAEAISVAIEPATAPPVPSPGELRGCSVDHLVLVRGLSQGTARLHLVLARPVKSSRGPLASFTVAVTVSR